MKTNCWKAKTSWDNIHTALEKDLDKLLKGKLIDDYINPLLGIPGLNIHKDTLTEILDIVLLGIVKYYWGQIVFILDKSHAFGTLQVHFDSCYNFLPFSSLLPSCSSTPSSSPFRSSTQGDRSLLTHLPIIFFLFDFPSLVLHFPNRTIVSPDHLSYNGHISLIFHIVLQPSI